MFSKEELQNLKLLLEINTKFIN